MIYFMIEPMHNTDYGNPLEVVQSLWKGLTILRKQVASVRNEEGLRISDHSVLSQMNKAFETMVQRATNYFVVVYLFRDLPWREKAPLRRVFDSRSCEEFNSYLRLMYQSVNFDFEQLYRAISRHRSSSKAKAAMEKKGIKVAQPKGKAMSYAAASGKETTVDWDRFEEQLPVLESSDDG
jgi:hypothetical protein